jgi:hypothetical protein
MDHTYKKKRHTPKRGVVCADNTARKTPALAFRSDCIFFKPTCKAPLEFGQKPLREGAGVSVNFKTPLAFSGRLGIIGCVSQHASGFSKELPFS